MITRYLYGWYSFFRAFRAMRVKKHGAGKQPLILAWRAGMAYRWLVDGQFRRGKFPRYARVFK